MRAASFALHLVLCVLVTCGVATPAQAQTLTNGQIHAGTIGSAAEVDQWTFSATQGESVLVALAEVPRNPDTGFVPYVLLYGTSGNFITSSFGNLAARIGATIPLTGTYTVRVQDGSGQNRLGDYRLNMALMPGPALPVVSAGDEGGALVNGDIHTGRIEVGDIDQWTFTAQQGESLLVAVAEVPVGPGVPDPGFVPYLLLYGPNGNFLTSSFGSLAARIGDEAPLAGRYTVVVMDGSGGTDRVGDYRLNLAHIPGPSLPFVAGGDEGGALTNGAIHTGRIASGDMDQWTFTAQQGESLLVALGEVPVGSGIPDPGYVPYVLLYGPNGNFLTSDFGALAARVGVVAPLTGRYTVVVLDGSGGTERAGDYKINLAQLPGPALPTVSQNDQGGGLTNGAMHSGRIEIGDMDQWTFTAQQGDSILVALGEVPVGSGVPDPGFVPYVLLYGPNGAFVTSSFGSLAARIGATANLTGRYTVVVIDGSGGKERTGDYLVNLALIPGTALPTVSAGDHGGTAINGAIHSGRIEIGDMDQWTFTAQQGETIFAALGEVPVGPGTVDPGFVPYLLLYGPNGQFLTSSFGALAARLADQAPLTGRYTLVVIDGSGGTDRTGDYRLNVALIPGPALPTVSSGDQGGALANGSVLAGRIEIGDMDQWTFTAGQGSALSIVVSEIPVGPGVPDPGFVPYVLLYGPTGTFLTSDFDQVAAQLTYRAPATGRYTILVVDGTGGTDRTGDYQIVMNGAVVPPPAPTTVDDPQYSTAFNTSLIVPAPGILANDVNAATASLVTTVSAGTLSLNASGAFNYTPPTGFSGVVTFTYRAVNASGPGNVATVTIAVQTATSPTAAGDSYTAIGGTTLTVPAPGVLGNDTSPGGSALSAVLNSSTTHGSLGLNANGSFTYTPNAGFSGSDAFTYRATNANGSSNVATVTIAVASAVTGVQPPVNLRARSIVGNTITLVWGTPTAGPAPTGYLLEGGVTPGQVLAAFPTGSATPTFTLNAPNGAFYLRLKSLEGGQASAASNEIRVFVNQPVAPSAPSHLTGLTNGSQVGLSWRNTFAGGTPSSLTLDVSGTLSGSLPLGPIDTFTFPAMPAGTYTFSVRASNAFGSSGSSNSVTLTFPTGCTGAPQVPENFLAYASGNVLNLAWDPAGTGAATTSYVLNVSGAVNVSVPWVNRGLSVPVGPGSYTFSIAAVNSCGTSAATAAQTVVVP